MSDDEMRVAIAEACGWKPSAFGKCDMAGNPFPGWDTPPDYFHDLNAMHEAVTSLSEAEQVEWAGYLYDVARANHHDKDVAMAQATAAQRAEAFGKTLNLWE